MVQKMCGYRLKLKSTKTENVLDEPVCRWEEYQRLFGLRKVSIGSLSANIREGGLIFPEIGTLQNARQVPPG